MSEGGLDTLATGCSAGNGRPCAAARSPTPQLRRRRAPTTRCATLAQRPTRSMLRKHHAFPYTGARFPVRLLERTHGHSRSHAMCSQSNSQIVQKSLSPPHAMRCAGSSTRSRSRWKRATRFASTAFGNFKTAQRAARLGRNPRTGEAVKVPARRVVPFFPRAPRSRALSRAHAAHAGPRPDRSGLLT